MTGPPDGHRVSSERAWAYSPQVGDEVLLADGKIRDLYFDILSHVRHLTPAERLGRCAGAARWAETHGLSFVVDQARQRFSVDLVPRIVSRNDWDLLGRGLIQRARAIEAFLQDVYGEGRIMTQGILAEDQIRQSPGWWQEASRLPRGTLRAPIQGFDIVRNEAGEWRVLEDNVRSPSGVAYSVAVRSLLNDVMGDLPRPQNLLDPAAALPLLRASILGAAGPNGTGAVWSSGQDSGAWYEHQRVSELPGLLLADADDMEVVDSRVVHRPSGRRIDSVYLRFDGELVDQVNSSGQRIGAEIFEVAAQGGVFLANAPGNGVADDKAMYCVVPDLISFYLHQEPLLQSVPTYRAGDRAEYSTVIERMEELVIKPVDGEGGRGVMIGPDASTSELAARRELIAANPKGWIGQEVLDLSWHPSLVDGELQPRRVDLRAFVYATGPDETDYQVGPAALTRMAAEGSRIVNSSRGGGAKDTWIMGTA